MNITNIKIRNRVKQVRESNALTQKELAIKSGISERNIQSIEAGSDPRMSTALKIAETLNTTVENLFPVGAGSK